MKKIKADDKPKNENYYQKSAMQPIEVMQAVLTPEQFKGFLMGNIIKYRMRAKYKENYDKDMEKANIYSNWLQQYKEGFEIKPNVILGWYKEDYIGL